MVGFLTYFPTYFLTCFPTSSEGNFQYPFLDEPMRSITPSDLSLSYTPRRRSARRLRTSQLIRATTDRGQRKEERLAISEHRNIAIIGARITPDMAPAIPKRI